MMCNLLKLKLNATFCEKNNAMLKLIYSYTLIISIWMS